MADLRRILKKSFSSRRPPSTPINGLRQQPVRDKGGLLSHTILLVDDSQLVRHALRGCLEANPEWVVCGEAADGRTAIQMTEELKPDLVVLDLSMPGMNGFQVARELKQAHPSLPLLLFTSFKTQQLEKEALAAGCNAVLSKSDHQDRLFENIHRLLPKKNFGVDVRTA
jgi:DNA-binding NarL/FixJ family response regulator